MNKDMNGFVMEQETMHRINPLGLRVLVKILDSKDTSNGGLFLPENTKENMSESVIAKVVAVASAVDDETQENTNISGIPENALVLIEKCIGVKVPWNDKLRMVETIDILAIVESTNLS